MNPFVRWCYSQAHGATRLNWWFSKIWYRYYCPYPIIDDVTARACVRAGKCGCKNKPRYSPAETAGAPKKTTVV